MFRSLIALVVTLAITITGFVKPAYAYSNFNGKGYDEKQDISNAFIDGLIKGAMETLGVAIGGAIVCYSVAGIATTVFPPAGALAVACPTIGSASAVGVKAVAEGVKTVAKAL